jgi:polyphosphate kinase
MLPDGSYVRDEGGEGTSSQEALYRYFSTRKVSLAESPAEPVPPAAPEAEPEVPRRGSVRAWLRRLIGS